jgi:hypothetical protein
MIPISPLQLNQLSRDYWGWYDPPAIAQLAELATSPCYQPKFYKAPDTTQEVIAANGYLDYGLKITPGSLIVGVYLPARASTGLPPQFSVMIRDVSLKLDWFDQPAPSVFLANYLPTYLSAAPVPSAGQFGSFPSLLSSPWPVVGSGLFNIEFWETSGAQQRIELVFGVLEVMEQ